MLETMCDYNDDLASKNSEGLTPLMFAAKHGYNDIVNFLTQRTNDLNEEDANSLTILMHRLLENDFKMARKMLSRGADINYINRNGFTPLHLCVKMKRTDAVRFLLEKGAIQHIVDMEGRDACDMAQDNGIADEIQEFHNCNPRKKAQANAHNHAYKERIESLQSITGSQMLVREPSVTGSPTKDDPFN